MDRHEIEFITINKTTLISLINCTDILMDSLIAKKILSEQDKQEICAKATPNSKTSLLLDILTTRSDSYQQFIETLKTQTQTGAVKLLESIYPTESFQTPLVLADTLEDWLQNPSSHEHNFLLFSRNVIYSMKWISISVANYSFLEHSENLQESHNLFSAIFEEHVAGYFGQLNDRFLVICDSKDMQKVALPETWKHAEDGVKWSDLTSDMQNLLLNREILFQNQKIFLSFICAFILKLRDEAESEHNILNQIDSTLLVELVDGKVPQLVDGNIPNKSKHYIHRTLRPRHRIARVVLNVTRNQPKGYGDIFVIKCDGLRLYQFQSFVDKYGNKQCDLWSNQIKLESINVNAILLDTSDYDFGQICEKSGQRPVHLLKAIPFPDDTKQISKLFWICSKGSMQILQKYVHRTQSWISEKKLYAGGTMSNATTPVCISDTAGKGKTYLLTHVAKNLQTSVFDQKELVYVNYATMHELLLDLTNKGNQDDDGEENDDVFSENGAYINTSDKNLNLKTEGNDDPKLSVAQNYIKFYTEDIIEALIQRSSKYWIGREFVSVLLSRHKMATNISLRNSFGLQVKLELMFDGIDELDTAKQQEGIEMVRAIQHKAKFIFPVRLWTATRPHLLGHMEDCLETLGYEICPFLKEYQIELLTDIWIQGTKIKRNAMKKVATETLQKFHEKFSQPDESQDVAGLPLLFDLLAESFKSAAKNICQHNEEENNFNRRITDLTIATIYKTFIETKFENVDDEKVYLCHMEEALKFIFGNRYEPGLIEPTASLRDQALFSYGIVEAGSLMQPIKFIHSTFASYFAAQAMLKIIDNLQSWDHNTATTLALKANFGMFRRILSVEETLITLSKSDKTPLSIKAYKFKHPATCYFLNFSTSFNVNVKNILELLILGFGRDRVIDFTKLIKRIWQYLIASIAANHYNIAFPLVQALKLLFFSHERYITLFAGSNPDYVISDLVMLSAKCASKDLMELVCEFNNVFAMIPVTSYKLSYTDVPDSIYIATLTPLHISFEAGNFKVATFLLNKEGFLDDIKLHLLKYRCLLHACIINSVENRKLVISRKKEIMNLLAEICPNLFVHNIVGKDIELERMHLELLLEYLRIREDIEFSIGFSFSEIVVNKYGENIMHLLPQGHYDDDMTPQKYHSALLGMRSIFKPVRFLKYIFSKHAFGWCAIDVAASKLDLLPETFQLLRDSFHDAQQKHQDSIDLLNRLKENTRKLIEAELQLDQKLLMEKPLPDKEIEWALLRLKHLQKNKTREEISKLHNMFANLEMRKDYVEKFNYLDYKRVDFRSSNILFKAVAGQRDVKFLKQLLDLKIGFAPKSYNVNILHVAAANFNYSAVKLFVKQCSIGVNVVDEDGNTPLHMCFRSDELKKNARDFDLETRLNEVEEQLKEMNKQLIKFIHKAISIARTASNIADIVANQRSSNFGAKVHQSGFLSRRISWSGEDNVYDIRQLYAGTQKSQQDNRVDKSYQVGLPISRRLSWTGGDKASALKGLLLNPKLGHFWHPSLIFSFADKIKEYGGDIYTRDDLEGGSLLHWAARKHSFYGVKYLIEVAKFSAGNLDDGGNLALDFMQCEPDCKMFNCLKIRQYLRKSYLESEQMATLGLVKVPLIILMLLLLLITIIFFKSIYE